MFGAPTSSADRQVCRGEPRALRELGEFLGLARGRIRQIECKVPTKAALTAVNSALPQAVAGLTFSVRLLQAALHRREGGTEE
jgi:hypothetical protein